MHFLRSLVLPALAAAHLFFGASAAHAAKAAEVFAWPAELEGFTRGELVDFESRNPGLGIGLPYNAPGIKVTLYVYDAQIADLPEGIDAGVVRDQSSQAERDILRSYKEVRIMSPQAPATGHCANFLQTQVSLSDPRFGAGDNHHSHLYLGSRKGHFVKMRITYKADDGAPDRRAAQDRFAQAVCKLVAD